jgi:hypothetical protein
MRAIFVMIKRASFASALMGRDSPYTLNGVPQLEQIRLHAQAGRQMMHGMLEDRPPPENGRPYAPA